MTMWDGEVSDEWEIQMRPRLSLLSEAERSEFLQIDQILKIISGTDDYLLATVDHPEFKLLKDRQVKLLMKQLKRERQDRDK